MLLEWEENLSWTDERFSVSPMWIQVCHIPTHWLSIDTGRKIGCKLGSVRDVLIMDVGGRDERHIKILVDLDLNKPLLRGIMLKYKMAKHWVEFRYEQLPIFCFYCGRIGHNEKLCSQRKEDLSQNKVQRDQFRSWLKADARKKEWVGSKVNNARKETRMQDGPISDSVKENKGKEGVNNEVIAKGLLHLGDAGRGEKGGESEREVCCLMKDADYGCTGDEGTMGEEGAAVASSGKINKIEEQEGQDLLITEVVGRGFNKDQEIVGDCLGMVCRTREQSAPLRVPLQDYTNRMAHAGTIDQGDRSKGSKGQWKRKARMQRTVNKVGKKDVQNRNNGEQKKRGVGDWEGDSATEEHMHSGKKGRIDFDAAMTQLSEAEETSRKWSQPYK